MNLPPYGDQFRKVGAYEELLKVRAQENPNLTVKINPGGYWVNGQNYVEYVGGNTPNFAVPSSGTKWDVVCLNPFGLIQVITGTPATNDPQPPTVPKEYLPLAFIYIPTGTTSITQDKVYDARPWLASGGYPTNHVDLTGRSSANAHPIAAITDLQATLDNKVDIVQHESDLEDKADSDGTDAEVFTLNKDWTGDPSSDIYLMVERGNATNVGIRWNESSFQRWEWTDDGLTWNSFAAGADASFTPSNASDWDSSPTTISDALNELAARLRGAGY